MNKEKKQTPFNRRNFLIGLGAGSSLLGAGFLTAGVGGCTLKQKQLSSVKPQSPYLIERETTDEGFSRGWMPHFAPNEDQWVDMHVHIKDLTGRDSLKTLLDEWFLKLDTYRLGKIVAITEQDELFDVFGEIAQNDTRFAWMFWPKINAPSLSKIREAVRNGSRAIKLHNAPVMTGEVPRNIWQSDEWQEIFAYLAEAGIPLMWHITNRTNYSPYHGGGLHPYWGQGWAKGVTFTNENLLQDALALMRRFPKLKIIGAHQLYVGIDRLNQLLKEYENLYIESSCGMYLRWADDFSDDTRQLLREFVETWSERILFGSDALLFPGSIDDYAVQSFLCHARFMLKLWINDKALQDVAWRTTCRLLKLEPGKWVRHGYVRP